MKRGCWTTLFIVLLVVVVAGIGAIGVSMALQERHVISLPGREAVGILDIKGILMDPEPIVEELKRLGKDSRVKAIVARIDSPGGSAPAAQEVYREILKVREKGKKVIASMGNVAASGGYYVACAANEIYVNPGTLTLSIGVLAEFPNLEGLMDKVGVRFETIKTGKFKDTGTFTRTLTEEERQYMQELLEDVYEQFVEAVAEGRQMSIEEVRQFADGRALTGRQALKHGLVDAEGNLEDAIMRAAELAGIEGEPYIVRKKKRRSYSLLDLMDTLVNSRILLQDESRVSLMYILR